MDTEVPQDKPAVQAKESGTLEEELGGAHSSYSPSAPLQARCTEQTARANHMLLKEALWVSGKPLSLEIRSAWVWILAELRALDVVVSFLPL